MRAIGVAERALELMCVRAAERKTFGKILLRHVRVNNVDNIPQGLIVYVNRVYVTEG